MRRQLPVYSPLSFSALAGAALSITDRDSVARLCELVQSAFGAHDVVLTDSGTSALGLALRAACGEHGLAALPAYSCYDLATAADAANVRVVLYDVDPATLAPEEHSLASALAARPNALVAVHLYGLPIDMDSLRTAAAVTSTLVIEDAAQGVGASYDDARVGTRGEFAVLSFGRGKGLSGGGGGALLITDEDAQALLRKLAAKLGNASAGAGEIARAAAQWLLGRPALYGGIASLPFLHLGETIYHAPWQARSISRASARIVTRVWSNAEAEAQVRRLNAERMLATARASTHWHVVEVAAGARPGYLRLPILARQARSDVLTSAATSLGVMPGYAMPLSRLDAFRTRCINPTDAFPGAELLASQLITLPTHSRLTSADLSGLEAWLADPHRTH